MYQSLISAVIFLFINSGAKKWPSVKMHEYAIIDSPNSCGSTARPSNYMLQLLIFRCSVRKATLAILCILLFLFSLRKNWLRHFNNNYIYNKHKTMTAWGNICRICSSPADYDIFAKIPTYLHGSTNEYLNYQKPINVLLEETSGLKVRK